MLINLTNHPFETWQAAMKKTAIDSYGNVVNLPFPAVSPNADRVAVEELASLYLMEIQVVILKHNLSPGDVTIHLMGEFTFTYTLLTLLEAAGIPAVASTTERNTIDQPDGSKTVNFSFVRFREYYNVTNKEIK